MSDFYVAVTVRFEETSYEFVEWSIETSNICVVSSGESDIPFTVTLSTLDGTAAGMVDMKSVPKHTYQFFFLLASDDYRVIDGANLTFEVLETRKCMEIILTNDVVLESDEFFTLLLTSSSDSVSVLTSFCTISIIDDDGGCPYHYEKNVHMLFSQQK